MNSRPAASIADLTAFKVFTFPAGMPSADSRRTIVVKPIPAVFAISATVSPSNARAALICPLVINLKLPYNDIKYIINVIFNI